MSIPPRQYTHSYAITSLALAIGSLVIGYLYCIVLVLLFALAILLGVLNASVPEADTVFRCISSPPVIT